MIRPALIARVNSQADSDGRFGAITRVYSRAEKLANSPSRCFANKLAEIPLVGEKDRGRIDGSRRTGSKGGTAMRLALNNAARVRSQVRRVFGLSALQIGPP